MLYSHGLILTNTKIKRKCILHAFLLEIFLDFIFLLESCNFCIFSINIFQVVLCFSPVGATLRVRSRKFPALTNCTSIDWFHEWPEEALMSVSERFLSEGTELTVSESFSDIY